MFEEQDSLSTNLASFLDTLWEQDLDFHLAVVTTDSYNFQGPVPVMTPSTPALQAMFADAVSVGTGGSATEQGLRWAVESLSPPLTSPGGHNDGFLREDANLHVVIVSDEDDQSPGDVPAYVSNLAQLKASSDQLVVSGITGQLAGCYSPAGSAYACPRYEDAVAVTSGVSESICDAAWADTLATVAWASSSLEDTFALSHTPVEGTIRVEIDGVQAFDGWDYDEVVEAVVFQPGYVPQTGDRITIHYHLPGSC